MGRYLILVFAASLAILAQPTYESTINFQPFGSGAATTTSIQTREQNHGYAYPDFCTTVDGSTTDNTGCLISALGATGVNFGVLEVPAIGTSGTGATSTNYICSSLGLTWPAPTARVHIWKGATLSCAFPPADATHIVQDDNLAPIVPWPATAFPATVSAPMYTCITGCGSSQISVTGTYTGTQAGNYCMQIQGSGFSWNFTPGSTEQPNMANCTATSCSCTISPGTHYPLSNGLTASFSGTGSMNNDFWWIAVTPATVNPGTLVYVSVPTTPDVLCAKGNDTSISGVTCLNTTDDVTTPQPFQTVVPIPANAWAPGRIFRVTAQFNVWTSASPPTNRIHLGASGVSGGLTATGTIGLTSGLTSGQGASAAWLVVASAIGGSYISQPLYNTLPGVTTTTAANTIAQPVAIGTASFTIGLANVYSAGTAGNAIQLQSLLLERVN